MKRKLLFVTNNLTYSDGVAISLRNLANSLSSRGFEIAILCLFKKEESFLQTFDSKIRIVVLFGFYFRGFKRFIKPFARLIVRFNPAFREKFDIFIAYQRGLPTLLVSLIQSKNGSPSKIGFVHGTDLRQKAVHQSFSKIVCISEDGQKALQKFYDKPNRIVHIKNVYDLPLIQTMSNCEPDSSFLDFIRGSFSFCWVSRISPEKGVDLLINSCTFLKGSNIKVAIIGDGPDYSKCHSLIEKMGLSAVVRMFGSKSNPYPYIKSCNAFVCPSRSEGMCTSVVEAVLLEKPVVSTDVGGSREVLQSPDVGLIVSQDSKALSTGMSAIANGMIFPIKNFDDAKLKFSVEETVHQYIDLFGNLKNDF